MYINVATIYDEHIKNGLIGVKAGDLVTFAS